MVPNSRCSSLNLTDFPSSICSIKIVHFPDKIFWVVKKGQTQNNSFFTIL